MALPVEVTDPGSVNAETQAFGLGVPVQVAPFGSSPASAGSNDVDGDSSIGSPLGVASDVTPGEVVANLKPGVGIAPTVVGDASRGPQSGTAEDVNAGEVVANQGFGLGLAADADGDGSRGPSGTSKATIDTTQNNVVANAYGSQGLPRNVNVG